MEAVVAWHCSEAATLRLPNFLVIDLMTGVSRGSVKVLLPTTRGGLLPLVRVGRWLFAYALLALVSLPKNEQVDEADTASKTTPNFWLITAAGRDHGR